MKEKKKKLSLKTALLGYLMLPTLVPTHTFDMAPEKPAPSYACIKDM